ncbi:MAG: hypothetical protein AAGF94_17030 [Pseudomonadota bacterium]
MKRVPLISAAGAVMLLLGQSTFAAANVGPIADVLCSAGADMRERLETYYRAERSWAGMRGPDEVMELWQDADGDWTLIIRYAGGNWCIVAMGEALEPFSQMPHS